MSENSNDLFGAGTGVAVAREVKCDICGKVRNEGKDDHGNPVLLSDFAGVTVLECCWDKIENEVIRRMPDILPWYLARVAETRRQNALKEDEMRKAAIIIKEILA